MELLLRYVEKNGTILEKVILITPNVMLFCTVFLTFENELKFYPIDLTHLKVYELKEMQQNPIFIMPVLRKLIWRMNCQCLLLVLKGTICQSYVHP